MEEDGVYGSMDRLEKNGLTGGAIDVFRIRVAEGLEGRERFERVGFT